MIEQPVVLQVAVNGYVDPFTEFLWRTHKWAWACDYVYRCVTAPAGLPRDDCGWLKMACVEQLLQKYRTVFLVDADAYVMEECPRLESILRDDAEIYAKVGFSGRINSGVMIFHHGVPKSTLADAFRRLFANCDKKVPPEDRAPQENGHVINCWKNWPTLKILPPPWNTNTSVFDYDGTAYVTHAQLPGMDLESYKKKMRKISNEKNPQPLWYRELPERRRESRAGRVRYYARKLAEIGII